MSFTEIFPLDELITATFSGRYREDLAVITGPRSDPEIAALVGRLVLEELGTKLHGALFATKSVGAVFGLELVSGERVVLKLFHPSHAMTALVAMQRCIALLVRSGFPAPPPRSRLFQTEDGIAGSFYAFADGEMRDGHDPAVRRELARTLAELTGLLAREDPQDLPLAPTQRQVLWPGSHRSFLQLDEVPEARWIDAIAGRAQSVVCATQGPLIPAHLDWGVKNVRFRGDRVCVAYDWDSLCAASEAEMVGRAAAQFTAQWDFAAPLTPTPDEARAFVADYETARGRAFSDEESLVIVAAAEYLMAQVARLELAAGDRRRDSFLALLQFCAHVPLLEVGARQD
jgi:Ser/Thr protein kinase RdoA (MazF antagonist)